MDTARGGPTRAQLAGAARTVFGAERGLVGVSRLRGGSKKGVYRLTFDDGGTAIAYVWSETEDYWPEESRDLDGPFAHASGIDLFEAAHRRLEALGVRTPRVYLADRSRRQHPADLALVEDVPGDDLETLLQHDPHGMKATMARLAEALEVMRRHTAAGFGKVAPVEGGRAVQDGSCEQVVYERALGHLAEAAARDGRIAAVRDRLADEIHERAAAVRPRSRHGLVHGELGPDHVLVNRHGEPVLIDIEGLMFFDVEWEHAFLRIRFGEHYRWLDSGDLDQRRLAFYALAMRLSLVAGPLRLLDGDFPDRDFMAGIAEHNIRETLACLPSAGPEDRV
ncbi:MAG TPA: phosphotransferase [Streptosporangiaceae bacterium]